jgi:hypothetical protein
VPLAVEKTAEYIVDRIIGSKLTGDGKILYLVVWRGFPEAEATWEPAENLIDGDGTINEELDTYLNKSTLATKKALQSIDDILEDFNRYQPQRTESLSKERRV